MNKCPICKTNIKESNPNYCKKCAKEVLESSSKNQKS